MFPSLLGSDSFHARTGNATFFSKGALKYSETFGLGVQGFDCHDTSIYPKNTSYLALLCLQLVVLLSGLSIAALASRTCFTHIP